MKIGQPAARILIPPTEGRKHHRDNCRAAWPTLPADAPDNEAHFDAIRPLVARRRSTGIPSSSGAHFDSIARENWALQDSNL
jgi:hypothetical protein